MRSSDVDRVRIQAERQEPVAASGCAPTTTAFHRGQHRDPRPVVRGRLNATSVMVVTRASIARKRLRSMLQSTRLSSRAAIGLHLTLTAPFRPLSEDYEPVCEGAFLPLAATLRRAAMPAVDRDALAARSQPRCEVFVDTFGRAPDFIDGHQHVQLFPQISEARARGRAGTGARRLAAPMRARRWRCGRRFADRKGLLLDILSDRFRRRAAALGMRTNPAFAGTYEFNDRAGFRGAVPAFPRRAAGRQRGDVPSGLRRCANCSGSIRSPRCASRNMPISPARPFRRCSRPSGCWRWP